MMKMKLKKNFYMNNAWEERTGEGPNLKSFLRRSASSLFASSHHSLLPLLKGARPCTPTARLDKFLPRHIGLSSHPSNSNYSA